MKKIIILPLVILAIGFGGFWYMKKTKAKNDPIQIEEQVWVVSVVSIKPSALSPTLTLYGRVESPRTATLRAPTQSLNINAKVIEVPVLEGETVKKGDRLISLEDKDSIFNLKQREADIVDIEAQIEIEKQRHANNISALTHEESLLKLMQTSVERLRQLQKLSPQSALDEAQQAVEREMLQIISRRLEIKNHKARLTQLKAKRVHTVAQRDLSRLELARTKIIAPFSGIIAKVFVAPGDRVRSGDALLSLYDNTALEVRAQIPTRYQDTVLEALAAGHQLQANALVNKKSVFLQLNRVSGQINPDSGGIDGLFGVMRGGKLLRLGEFLSLFLSLPKQSDVVALPFEAVYGRNHIYKLVDGRMRGVTIERLGEQVLASGKSQILVRSPKLQVGDQVIVTQLPNAIEGLKVIK